MAEEGNIEKKRNGSAVEGDSEESEEEALVYDRSNGETSENSGRTKRCTRVRRLKLSHIIRK